jgi:hypothetical protein
MLVPTASGGCDASASLVGVGDRHWHVVGVAVPDNLKTVFHWQPGRLLSAFSRSLQGLLSSCFALHLCKCFRQLADFLKNRANLEI